MIGASIMGPHNSHFKGKRLLVLGAGASRSFGYPLGCELLQRIRINLPDDGSPLYKALRECGYSSAGIKSFYKELSNANVNSIDYFLDQTMKGDADFTRIGRMAIANELFNDEHKSAYRLALPNWYHQLHKVLMESLRSGEGPTLGIVTFNYDRSLIEFFRLFRVPRADLPCGAATLTDAIPILHVHGCLGPSELKVEAVEGRAYGAPVTAKCITDGADKIKIMHELDHDHGRSMVEAKKMIEGADRVVFVGFGYDAWNLQRLNILRGPYPVRWEGGLKYFGTAFDADSARISELGQLSAGHLKLEPSKVDVVSFARNGLRERLLGQLDAEPGGE